MGRKKMLYELLPGDKGIITRFLKEVKDYMQFYEMGIIPGACVEFIRRAPFQSGFQVKIQDVLIFIKSPDTRYIEVELI